jgi:zinc protease
MKLNVAMLLISLCWSSLGAVDPLKKVTKLKWEDLEVVYLEDDRFPTYSLIVYFADGALKDGKVKGVADATLSFLSLGTRRYSRKEIAGNLEFYGAGYSSKVTHEYSSYSIFGLVKDMEPTLKKICHLFQDADFPLPEVKKEKKRILDSLENIISNPSALASRVFREQSLRGTPYDYPVEGKIRDIKKWGRNHFKSHLAYLNKDVKKRIYITGPKSVLKAQNIINEDCGWKGKGLYERVESYKMPKEGDAPRITLIPISGNQAQVRIGRFLSHEMVSDPDLMHLTSNYLGGGFTSQLMQVLRVQGGLTYGAYAFAGGQKQYGRSGITTSTKKESLDELIGKTKDTVKKVIAGEINPNQLKQTKGSVAGSYLFGFESSSDFLQGLSYLDHVGRPYSSLIKFPERVRSYSSENVAGMSRVLYNWESLDIVIVGPRSLKKELKKYGNVEVKSYKDFL